MRVGPWRSAVARTTTAPRYTLRPRKRTEGGVWRVRHPSTAQQKLWRRSYPSGSSAGPPRGLRGNGARCSPRSFSQASARPFPSVFAFDSATKSRMNSRSRRSNSSITRWRSSIIRRRNLTRYLAGKSRSSVSLSHLSGSRIARYCSNEDRTRALILVRLVKPGSAKPCSRCRLSRDKRPPRRSRRTHSLGVFGLTPICRARAAAEP